MIKIRLKRVKRLNPKKHFNPGLLDGRFVKGTLHRLPKKGENIAFFPSNCGAFNWWMTTSIEKITRHKTLTTYQTLNSTYHIKKGWK